MQLSTFAAGYRRRYDVSALTASDYLMVARCFEKWLGRPVELDDLTAANINDYLLHLSELKRSSSTIASRRRKLLILWRAAYRERETENAPDADRIRRIKVPAPNPQGLTREQTARLVAWCQVNKRRKLRLVPVPAGDYLAALFLFLWSSGMRLGDALSMEFAWIQPTITFKQSKTGRWHKARLSPATLEAIERIRTKRAMVWPRTNKSRRPLYKMIREAFKGAGLEGSSKWIRRGVATDVYLSGGDPGQALGHVPGSRVAFRHYVSQEAQLSPVSPTEL